MPPLKAAAAAAADCAGVPACAAEDHEDMDLPKVNEELRNFFLPKKQVQPEPEPDVEVKPLFGLRILPLACSNEDSLAHQWVGPLTHGCCTGEPG